VEITSHTVSTLLAHKEKQGLEKSWLGNDGKSRGISSLRQTAHLFIQVHPLRFLISLLRN